MGFSHVSEFLARIKTRLDFLSTFLILTRIGNQEELTEKKEDHEKQEVQKQEEERPLLSDSSSDEEKEKVRLFIDNYISFIDPLQAGGEAKEEEASGKAGAEAKGGAPQPLKHLAGGGYTRVTFPARGGLYYGGGPSQGRTWSILGNIHCIVYMYLQAEFDANHLEGELEKLRSLEGSKSYDETARYCTLLTVRGGGDL